MGLFNFFKRNIDDKRQFSSMKKYMKIAEKVRKLAANGYWDDVIKKCDYGINKFPEHAGGLLNFRGRAWFEKLKSSISSYKEKEELCLYYNKSLEDYN